MAGWSASSVSPQAGKVALVTGANSGIGWHTALELARADGDVILTARTEAKVRDAAERIRKEIPGAKVRTETLDLASLRSVKAFAERLSKEPKLDLLVNNAGVMAVPKREVTEDGFERQLGTNFLGHYALTARLLPVLLRSNSPRITTVSSGAANMGLKRIRFEDLQWEKSYGPWKAYCQSKLGNLLMTMELTRRAAAARVELVSNAAHPGFARTNLQTSGPGLEKESLPGRIAALFLSQDAAHGALPTLRAATAPEAGPDSYFGPGKLFGLKGDPVPIPMPKPAQDREAARRLWEIAQDLTGVEWRFA